MKIEAQMELEEARKILEAQKAAFLKKQEEEFKDYKNEE